MSEIKHLPKASAVKHSGSYPEQTPASIAAAKAECEAKRARLTAEYNLVFDGPDGSVRLSKADREALETRLALEAIETLYQLVRQYGSPRVSIWLEAAAQRAGESR